MVVLTKVALCACITFYHLIFTELRVFNKINHVKFKK